MKKSNIAPFLLSLFGITAVILVPVFSLRETREFTPVTIPAGDYSLQGYLSPGSDPESPFIVFFHGNRPEGIAHPLYQHILQMFPQEMTVLGVDILGYGQSKADPSVDPVRIMDHEEDWRGAVAYLEESLGAEQDQIILVGHSGGATMVMDAARKETFLLSIPIGLGDWQVVLDSPEKMRDHVNKIKAHTGVSLDMDMLRQYKSQYTPEVVFGSCPRTPVRLLFTRSEDGPSTLLPYFSEARNQCASLVDWRILPLGDHMYGTELNRFPKPVRELYIRISLTLLKWQLLNLIEQAEP